MKKYMYPILAAAMAVASCGKQANTEATADSLTVEENAAPTVEEVVSDPVYNLEIKTYAKNMLFKYDYAKKNLYHENNIAVEWPVKADGFDVKALQAAILENSRLSGSDIQKIVDDWARNESPDSGIGFDMEPVSKRVEESTEDTAGEEEEDDEAMFYFDTDCNLHISCLGVDSLHQYVTFQSIWSENNGCGLGSCVFMGYNYLTFDCTTNKVVQLFDVVKDESTVLKQLKKQNVDEDCEGLEGVESLPDTFYLYGNNIVFVFDKYEITYGAAGCPHLAVDLTKYASALTPYGKKLLGLE